MGVDAKAFARIALDVVDESDIADHPKISEINRRASQSALDQAKFESKQEADRQADFTEAESRGQLGANTLLKTAEDFARLEDIDPDAAFALMRKKGRNGQLAIVDAVEDAIGGVLAQRSKAELKLPETLFTKYAEQIGELSADDKERQRAAKRADIKEGGAKHSLELFGDLMAERMTKVAVAPKATTKMTTETETALGLLARIAEAAGNAPPKIGGTAATKSELTPSTYEAMSPTKQRELQKNDPGAIDAMYKKYVTTPTRG